MIKATFPVLRSDEVPYGYQKHTTHEYYPFMATSKEWDLRGKFRLVRIYE